MSSITYLAPCGTLRAQITPEAVATRASLIDGAYESALRSDHARALELAERAGAIQWSPSLHALVAEQQNALGQLAAALGSAQLCVQGAERDLSMPHRDVYLDGCRALVAALQPRVGHLVLEVRGDVPPGLHVTVSGQELPRALWSVPYVVPPGEVTVDAAAPGVVPFHQGVVIAEGAEVRVTMVLRPLAPPSPVPVSDGPGHVGSVQRTLGWVGTTVGGAGLVFGVVFNLVERASLSTFVSNGCYVPPGGSQTPTGGPDCAGMYASLDASRTASLVGYIGGGMLAAAGVVLLLTAPSRPLRPSRTHAGVHCGAGGLGLSCTGTF